MPSCDDLVRALRARGKRLTLQRRMVLEVLCAHTDHLTVHDIQRELLAQGTALTDTTVYRILQWLKEIGVVSQTDLGQSGIVYQLVSEQPHHHLVCLSCGAVLDIEDSVMMPLRDLLRREYGFEPRIDHMAIFGLCRACQSKGDETSSDKPGQTSDASPTSEA